MTDHDLGSSSGGSRTIARAGLIVSATYLLARILGYVRVLVIGTTFGASADLDSFFAAFRIPDLIFQLSAAGAVASAVVPMVGGLLATGERRRGWQVLATIANLMLVGLAILAAVAFVAAPPLVAAITPGFSGPQLAQTVDLTRIMLLAPILLALGAVATSGLNADRRFTASAVAPLVYNLAIIAAAVFLSPILGVTGLAIGVVAGSAGHLLVQIPPLVRAGFRFIPRIDLGDALARKALVLMGPRVVGLGTTQITFAVMTAVASGLGAGAISAYTLAWALLQIPYGVIGMPLGIVILPSLSRQHATGRTADYLDLVARALRILLFTLLPITAIGIVLRYQVVDLLLGYNRFDQAAVRLTSDTLLPFLLGLTAQAGIDVLARAFYARGNTRTPALAAVIAVIVNVTLGVALVGALGLPALGLAIATSAWIEVLFLFWWLARLHPEIDTSGIGSVAVRSGLAAIAAGAAAFGAVEVIALGSGTVAVAAQAAVAAVAGGIVFGVAAWLLRIPELRYLMGIATSMLRRRGGARNTGEAS